MSGTSYVSSTASVRRRALTVIAVCVLVALVAVGGFFFNWRSGNTQHSAQPSPSATAPQSNSEIAPTNDEQRKMLAQFRLATPDEYSLVREIMDFDSDRASWHVYVAVSKEVTLSRIDTPMVLILPVGHRWVAGQQGNVTILRTKGEALQNILLGGGIFADPMCTLAQAGVLKGGCYSGTINVPNSWDEMTTRTRKATAAEMKQWGYEGDDPARYLVATGDLRIAPQYTFDGTPEYNGVSAIMIPAGVKVLGGQLGFMDVYVLDAHGNVRSGALDSSCFMYAVGEGNKDADPHGFMPAGELERVKQCTR